MRQKKAPKGDKKKWHNRIINEVKRKPKENKRRTRKWGRKETVCKLGRQSLIACALRETQLAIETKTQNHKRYATNKNNNNKTEEKQQSK
jgi:hypothetical protein